MNMKLNLTPRNRELVIIAGHIAREANAAGRVLTIEQLAGEVRAARPLHFYYNYDQACRMMSLIRRYGPENFSTATDIRAGWLDLYRQVNEVMELRPRLNAGQALVHTLMFRRPSRVYLSVNSIRKILSPHFEARLTENGGSRA